MKKNVAAVAIALALLGTGAIATLSIAAEKSAGSRPQDSGESETKGAVEELGLVSLERAGTRHLGLYHSSVTESLAYLIKIEDEMDAQTVYIENGRFSNGMARKGGITVRMGDFEHYFAVDGYENDHFTFNPPLPLREGDRVTIRVPGGNTDGFTQISFIGRAPMPTGVVIR